MKLIQLALLEVQLITDVLATYENYQQQKASGKVDPSVYEFSQAELESMMEKANGK